MPPVVTLPPVVLTDAQIIASLNSADNAKNLIRSILAAKTLASSSPAVTATTGSTPQAGITPRPGVRGFMDGFRIESVGTTTGYRAELPLNPALLGRDLSIEAALLPLPVPPNTRPIIKGFTAPVALVNPPANFSQWVYRLAKAQGATIAIRADELTSRNYVLITGSIAQSLDDLLAEPQAGGGGGNS
jgi:hypothetical protein